MQYKIKYEKNPKPEELIILNQGIYAYAKEKKGLAPIESFTYFVRDEKSKVIAGCDGAMYYGCMYVDKLWVNERFRGKMLGRELMESAEKLGKEKGCAFITVNTMDWEALGFYQKLGYYVEFKRDGYLKNSTFYFLRKDF